eukprot:TRINITY_DN10759_c0_g1_i2.p1 TRINITY_DN10759_c0_g1~~TRINITY_DN10759_c0_g1_i2.p1  ORF type:complete len:165 (+),score=32.06 TRINITY_DN10759_c0_g1_i2:683-1177(+)
MRRIFEFAVSAHRPVYFNLGAKAWVTRYFKELMEILPMVEGVIGNAEEAIELGRLMSGSTSIEESILAMFKQRGRKKFVAITNASEPIVVGLLKSDGEVKIEKVGTPDVPKEQIKNVNGAGDTLAGSVIGGLIVGLDLIRAVELGQRFVSYYIQQSGGQYPEKF